MNPGWLGLDARVWGLIVGLMVVRHLIPRLMRRVFGRGGSGGKRGR